MQSVLSWYAGGGPYMLPVFIVGVAGLALLIERSAHVARRAGVNARPFMEHVLSLTRAKKYEEALAVCAEHHAALPDLGLVIIRSRASSTDDLLFVADAAKKSFIPTLRRRVAWLPALAAIGLLIGIASAMEGHPRALAAAALFAVPLVAGYAVIDNLVRTMMSQLEEFSIRLINALAGRPEVRLGHRS